MRASFERQRTFRAQVLAVTLARAVFNTVHRMVYPFLPEFSRGLGLAPETFTLLLSARNALGVAAPLSGGLADRFGRRQTMLAALGLFVVCVGALALWGTAPAFGLMALGVIVVKFLYDPAMQAYLGDRTAYARRGLVIAFSELGWSLAALIGIPLAGLLMERAGWRAPFAWFAGLGGLAWAALWLIIPADAPAAAARAARAVPWRVVWGNPLVLSALGLGVLASGANEILNVVYGVWLEQAFGLKVGARGLTLIVIGAAEVLAEVLVMILADRLGKRRAVGVGFAASALAYLALPLAAGRLPLALAGLFLIFLTFEFTIVASIPLMTEILPSARGAVMSGNVAAHAAGRMLGALAGGRLFRAGMLWSALAAAACNLAGLALLLFAVRERE